MARLGLRIAELRTLRALSQEQLAEASELSTRQVQRLEAGEANMAVESLADIAHVLRCEISELFEPPARAVKRRPGRPSKR